MNPIERLVRAPWYAQFVVAIWIFNPEMRRIIDWRTTFHSLSVISLIPLLALLPVFVLLHKDRQYWGRGYQRSTLLWMLAFGYGFLIAILTGLFAAALFAASLFCLPVVFGAIVAATSNRNVYERYRGLAKAVIICMLISSIYGIFQYISPPPWDSYWAAETGIEGSQGATVAYGFRIFGTLNSTGPFAGALMIAMITGLPLLSWRRWWVGLAYLPMTIALALTLVRSVWIALGLGLVTYLALSANRRVTIAALGSVTIAIVVLTSAVFTADREASLSLQQMADRVATFGDLDNDISANDRKGETANALAIGLSQPIGAGLGLLGTAAKLTSGETVVLDSGYLSRFLEMGFVGFTLFMGSLIVALVYAFKSYALARENKDENGMNIIAAAIAFQVMLIFSESSNDSHLGFLGLFYWALIAIVSQYRVEAESPELISKTVKAKMGRTGAPA